MEYFKNDLSLSYSGLKVKIKLKTKFCLGRFVNPILSKHKFCLNFMTKFLTFKTFILDLRQILDLRPFVNPTPYGHKKYDVLHWTRSSLYTVKGLILPVLLDALCIFIKNYTLKCLFIMHILLK